jgi:hypothetical protein
MSRIMELEAAEESLGGVGCVGDAGVCQEVKHVGQRLQQHRSRRAKIALHPLTFVCREQWCSMDAIPGIPIPQESLSVRAAANLQRTSEQRPQQLGVGALGISTAPALSLPLDMHQTPLNDDLGPDGAEHAFQLRISIDGGGERTQTTTCQLPTHLLHSPLAFLHAKDAGHDRLGGAIDEHHNTDSPTVQKGSVYHDMPVSRQIPSIARRMIEPIANHLTHLPGTQAALLAQLTDRVTVSNPADEPDALTRPMRDRAWANKTEAAALAAPALTTRPRNSVPSRRELMTTHTALFGSCSFNPLNEVHANTTNDNDI